MKSAPKSQKSAKGKAPAAAPKKEGKPARTKEPALRVPTAKGSKILALIGRPKSATLAEIRKATDWQAHSVRGFLSTAAKKHSLKIESTKTDAGNQVYQITK